MSEARMHRRFKKQDMIIIGILLAGILVLFLLQMPWRKASGQGITITVDGTEYGTFPLAEDAVVEIKNTAGEVTNTLTIRDGAAKMTTADCPDHYCLHQKKIRLTGETIVCLPNRVLVSVTGQEASDMDAVVR